MLFSPLLATACVIKFLVRQGLAQDFAGLCGQFGSGSHLLNGMDSGQYIFGFPMTALLIFYLLVIVGQPRPRMDFLKL